MNPPLPFDPYINPDSTRRIQWDGGEFYRDLYQWDFIPSLNYQCNIYDANDVLQPQYMESPANGNNLGVLKAWEITKGAGTIIAIADNGCDSNHPDLVSRIIGGVSLVDGPWSEDRFGHGTSVASVVVAEENDLIGIVGLAPKASLFVIKCNYLSSELPLIVDAAIAAGATILIMSWGFSDDNVAAKESLIKAGEHNMIIVCAGFNAGIDEGSQPDFPAQWQLPNVVVVSSSMMNDVPYPEAAFSNTLVHLYAPGRLIIVAKAGTNGYVYSSGTSLATPKVAGTLALIHSAYPNLTPVERINRLLVSVDRLPAYTDKTISGGRLNVGWAVRGPEITINMLNGLPTVNMKGPIGALLQLESTEDFINWYSLPLITANEFGEATYVTDNISQEFFRVALVRPVNEFVVRPTKAKHMTMTPSKRPTQFVSLP